jgi:hypothetical protein
MLNKTAEYRIRLSQLVVVPTSVDQPQPSICYPDRHRRSDKQIALTTMRYIAVTLIGVLVAITEALYMGVC